MEAIAGVPSPRTVGDGREGCGRGRILATVHARAAKKTRGVRSPRGRPTPGTSMRWGRAATSPQAATDPGVTAPLGTLLDAT